ncbi:MAG: LemA family protein [Patescibacteria group bacterium]
MIGYILIGIILLVGIGFILMYNALISSRNHVDEAWSDIEVQFKRRYDLIPNVLETVKGYAAHEKNVLESVTSARTGIMSTHTTKDRAQAENILSGTLKTLFAVSENYPDLKANANFLDLQQELADTENKIQASRRFFNSTVLEYNTKLQVIPTNLIAEMFAMLPREFFELENGEEEKKAPQINFKQ